MTVCERSSPRVTRETRGQAWAGVKRASRVRTVCFPFSFYIKSVLCLNLYRKLCADPKIVTIFRYVLCSGLNIGKMLNSIF